MPDDITALIAAVPNIARAYLRVEAAVARVRELHGEHRCELMRREWRTECRIGFKGCMKVGKCDECGKAWPCETIRALDGADS